MAETRSRSSHGRFKLNLTTEEHHMSSAGSGQRTCKSPTQMYSGDGIAFCEMSTFGCLNRNMDELIPRNRLSVECNSQRFYISQKIQNGIHRTHKFSVFVSLPNYFVMVLSFLMILTSIHSLASSDESCPSVIRSSDFACNCSVITFNNSTNSTNSTCEEFFAEQNKNLSSSFCTCENRTECSVNLDTSEYTANCSCESVNGFAEFNCEMPRVDPCANVTCSNGQICVEQSINSSYLCNCSTEFNGTICELISGNCNETHFCQHNGSCINNDSGGYTCNCTEGYTGFHCESKISKCNSSSPCANNGTCIDVAGGGYHCDCTNGYTGANCSDFDVCFSNPCFNNGNCSRVNDTSYFCNCNHDFTGFHCESKISKCNSSSPCANNGSCIDVAGGGYHCDCTDGYTGANCSDFDVCFSNPCFNNGNCSRVNDTSYFCNCNHDFTGDHCENYNPCSSATCVNGNCSNQDNSSICTCFTRFTGVYCNLTDYCYNIPCKNGGTCTDLLRNSSDYHGDCSISGNCVSCSCPVSFTGGFCETLNEDGPPIALIVGLTVGLFLLVLVIVVIILIVVVLNKRKSLGTYHPSRQEVANARLEINGGLKPPPEERLI